jgi:hypothetical protein
MVLQLALNDRQRKECRTGLYRRKEFRHGAPSRLGQILLHRLQIGDLLFGHRNSSLVAQ